MVRLGRIVDEALLWLGLLLLIAFGAVAVVLLLIAWLLNTALRNWAGVCLAIVLAWLLFGCATPRDPRDPDVWRPGAPAHYPEPR